MRSARQATGRSHCVRPNGGTRRSRCPGTRVHSIKRDCSSGSAAWKPSANARTIARPSGRRWAGAADRASFRTWPRRCVASAPWSRTGMFKFCLPTGRCAPRGREQPMLLLPGFPGRGHGWHREPPRSRTNDRSSRPWIRAPFLRQRCFHERVP
jgi:hypothetical protein